MKIDLAQHDDWNLTLIVRGQEIRTLSPLMVPEMNAQIEQRREGGLIETIRTFLFGRGPKKQHDQVETESMRRMVRAFVDEPYDGFVDDLRGGHLAQMIAAYMGAQQVWLERVREQAEAEARKIYEASKPAPEKNPATGYTKCFKPRTQRSMHLVPLRAEMATGEGLPTGWEDLRA